MEHRRRACVLFRHRVGNGARGHLDRHGGRRMRARGHLHLPLAQRRLEKQAAGRDCLRNGGVFDQSHDRQRIFFRGIRD